MSNVFTVYTMAHALIHEHTTIIEPMYSQHHFAKKTLRNTRPHWRMTKSTFWQFNGEHASNSRMKTNKFASGAIFFTKRGIFEISSFHFFFWIYYHEEKFLDSNCWNFWFYVNMFSVLEKKVWIHYFEAKYQSKTHFNSKLKRNEMKKELSFLIS